MKNPKQNHKAPGHTPDFDQRTFHIFHGYFVFNSGRIWSSDSNWRGYGKREMRQHPNSHGYPRVRLTVNGKRKSYLVHKLVAELFLGSKPSPKHEVCHRDGDKLNNSVSNLAWGTRKDNAADRERHGRTSRGENHSTAIKRGLPKRDDEATARLIAASPELYQCLKRVWTEHKIEGLSSELNDQIRALIARIEGEES